ncbi:MAG: putative PEP-binding protein, partial [Nitrosopumilaceae archaeon]
VRVGITFPEIYEMQIQAICEAAAELTREKTDVRAQIMVPQVGSIEELNQIKKIYDSIKSTVESKLGVKLKISFGTMVEVVRACLTAGEIAKIAEFFSFGTNDLTQAVFSFSREDAEGKFLTEYLEKEILTENPFQSLDVNGVGSLMQIAITNGRKTRPNLEIGICGEHGGDPNSIKFCHKVGFSYVSASSHRIPIAILAAAQAALLEKSEKKSSRKKR